METEWVPQMIDILGLDPAALPIIWDADFLYGRSMRQQPTATSFKRLMSAPASRSQTRRQRDRETGAGPLPQRPATMENEVPMKWASAD
jgi:hypothetical protein